MLMDEDRLEEIRGRLGALGPGQYHAMAEFVKHAADDVDWLIAELEKARNAFDLAFAVMKGRGDFEVGL